MIKSISLDPRTTMLNFNKPVKVVSWAPYNGGNQEKILHVVNQTVVENDFIDNQFHYGSVFNSNRIVGTETVVLLTAVSQKRLSYTVCIEPNTDLSVECFCTVGLGNSLSPGDRGLYNEELEVVGTDVHTINIIVVVNKSLTPEASLELMSVVTMAKCFVMGKYAKIISPTSGNLCMGTGTDCVAICFSGDNKALAFAGMHTKLGECVGKATKKALTKAIIRYVRFNHHKPF